MKSACSVLISTTQRKQITVFTVYTMPVSIKIPYHTFPIATYDQDAQQTAALVNQKTPTHDTEVVVSSKSRVIEKLISFVLASVSQTDLAS